jgi:hypothetical protein
MASLYGCICFAVGLVCWVVLPVGPEPLVAGTILLLFSLIAAGISALLEWWDR